MMEERWAARLPMGLSTIDIRTGEVKTIHKSNDWLNHLLFSPDGSRLAARALRDAADGALYEAKRAGKGRTAVAR